MSELYWRVDSPTGVQTIEPPENASIKAAPRGSVRLVVVKADGTPVIQVPLREAGIGYRPIFYRKRSQGVGDKVSRVDAVVFGKGREDGSVVRTNLWAIIGGKVIDCPQALIDPTMINLQITGLH